MPLIAMLSLLVYKSNPPQCQRMLIQGAYDAERLKVCGDLGPSKYPYHGHAKAPFSCLYPFAERSQPRAPA